MIENCDGKTIFKSGQGYIRQSEKDIIEFACATFSFLIRNQKMTFREFASEIKKHYDLKGDERIASAVVVLERYSV